ncbi:MAG TPA: DUF5916 domain-containing protein [Thermoanaerobaculia bacterium]|nr:DUF5916 domain-containing protein [Thermoanaerobaculia bacterium]
MQRLGLIMVFLAGLLAGEASGQEPAAGARIETTDSYRIERAAGPIEIDGVLDDAGWAAATPMPLLVETFPSDNVPAPVRTEALLAYDDSNFYVAIRAFDPDPAKIRAHLSDRDSAFNDDFAGIVLDTSNDGRRAFEFFVNPLGVQMDLFMNDVGGGEDSSWDAIWSSAGRITAEGYVVEIAIPFSSLRFEAAEGPRTWGVDVLRIWPRDQRRRFGLNNLDRDRNCYVCQFAKLTGLEGITPGRNLEIAPTITTQRTDVRNDFPGGALEGGDADFDAGVSASWGFTSNLTLNAAVNPDFSQVEADSAQLDVNTQFALFFEEKRPFFLEGADFFNTPLSVVYTRTVADPDWGAKVSGKEGKSALGLFVAQDSLTNVLIPGNQGSRFTSLAEGGLNAALRYRYDIGEASTLGLIATARNVGEYDNAVAGIDGYFRVAKSDTITAQYLRSQTEYPDSMADAFGQPHGSLDDDAFQIQYRHGTKEWFWIASWEDIGTEFRADSGFLPQVDVRKGAAVLERVIWGNDRTWYNRIFIGGEWDRTESQGGIELEHEIESWFGVAGPRQSFVFVDVGRRDRYFNGRTFDETFVNALFEINPSGSLYLNLEVNAGDEIDFANTRPGERLRLSPFVRWNAGRRTRLELGHAFETLDVEGGRLYTANLSQARIVYQFNIRTFLRTIIQYTDIDRDASLYLSPVPVESKRLFPQVLFAYKINPQTVLFAGYTENREGGGPIDLTQRDRTFFFKIGYAWTL